MATGYRRSPLGIVKLTRAEFERLSNAGRIMVCRTGTPYIDVAPPGGEPCWRVLEIEPECLCRTYGPLRELYIRCPVHGVEL